MQAAIQYRDPFPAGSYVQIIDHDGSDLGVFEVARSYWPHKPVVELQTEDGMIRQSHDRMTPVPTSCPDHAPMFVYTCDLCRFLTGERSIARRSMAARR